MTINQFEDIEAWQSARTLTKAIYIISNDGLFAKDFGLRDQIRRAAVSIMSNIAEGYGRGGNKEFMQFLSIAKGSVAEVQSQLYIVFDVGYIQQEKFIELSNLAKSTGNLIGGFIRYLGKSEIKGIKYK